MIGRAAALTLCLLAGAGPSAAEPYAPWDNDPFWDTPAQTQRPFDRYRNLNAPEPRAQNQVQEGGEEVRDGGPRVDIAPKAPIVVAFNIPDYQPGSIVIDSGGRKLYFVLPGNRAFQYPISVGREGFAWAGTEKISRKQAWPDWHPPAEMRQRDPKLPGKMLGGIRNPLGAMALYLGNTLYRIHGTNDEKTIGHASSSGCFRMMNSAVLHLAQFAQVGTPVTVVNRLPGVIGPPPVAVARPPAQLPPVAANRPVRVPPPASAWPDDEPDSAFDQRRIEQQPARRPPPPDDDTDVADVHVTPRRDRDDYDPYAVQRPAAARPYGRGGYGRSYDDRAENYGERRPGRVWYDDERDDF